MLEELIIYLLPLLWISPAYATNASPLFFSNIIKDRRALDLGKILWDGKRILGDGKTAEGTLFGLFTGLSYFTSLYYLSSSFNYNLYENFLEGPLIIMGAITGDLFGSFIKRRLGIERGEMLPIFDQTGFLIFAILFRSFAFGPLPYDIVIYLFLITFIVHVLTNLGAFKIGVKEKPF